MIRNATIGPDCRIPNPSLVNLYECTIGSDCTIGAFVEIGRGVRIGDRCKIGSGAFIPEGVTIEDDVFIGPNATFCNCRIPMSGVPFQPTLVKKGSIIGANTTILPGIIIAGFVGAGAVATRDIPKGETWVGNPAKRLPPRGGKRR